MQITRTLALACAWRLDTHANALVAGLRVPRVEYKLIVLHRPEAQFALSCNQQHIVHPQPALSTSQPNPIQHRKMAFKIVLSFCAVVAVAQAGILTSAPIAYTNGAPLAYAAAPGKHRLHDTRNQHRIPVRFGSLRSCGGHRSADMRFRAFNSVTSILPRTSNDDD